MGNLDQLLQSLTKDLFLLYEFEDPIDYPIVFQSSINLLEQNKSKMEKANFLKSNHIDRNPLIRTTNPHKKLISTDIQKISNGNYCFYPTNTLYSSVFELVRALSTQYDFNELFTLFTWQEFEIFLLSALEHYGYNTKHTFRFQSKSKRFEVDIVARDGRNIFFIDAKRWNTTTKSSSNLRKAALNQRIRAQFLIDNKIACGDLLQLLKIPSQNTFKKFEIYPIICVSSTISELLIEEGVAIISFSHFNYFLNHFPEFLPELKSISLNYVSFQKKIS